MVDLLNNPIRLAIANLLNIPIIQNSFIWINVWSIIHLLSGIGIFYLLIKTFKIKKYAFVYLFALLLIFEIFEFFCYTNWFVEYFIREEYVDVFWDITISMLGGVVAWLIWKKK